MDLDETLGLDRNDPSTRLAALLVAQDELLMDRLIEMRREADLSQKDVAECLGVTQSAVAKFESGERDPRLSTLRRYALAVGASVTHDVRSDSGDPSTDGQAYREELRERRNRFITESSAAFGDIDGTQVADLLDEARRKA